MAVLYDGKIHHPFLALHRDFPNHNSWNLAYHLTTLYAVIEDLAHVASDLEQVANWLKDEICHVEEQILQSETQGRDVWESEYQIDDYLKSINQRTGWDPSKRKRRATAKRSKVPKEEKQTQKV